MGRLCGNGGRALGLTVPHPSGTLWDTRATRAGHGLGFRVRKAHSALACQCQLHPGSSGKDPCPRARRSGTATASGRWIPQLSCLTGPGARAPLSGLPVKPRRGFSGDQQQHPFRERLLVPSWSAAGQHRPLAPAAPRPREGLGAGLPPHCPGKRGRTSLGQRGSPHSGAAFLTEAFRLNTNLFKKPFFSRAHACSRSLDCGVWFRGGSRVHCCCYVLVSWAWSDGLLHPCFTLTS